MCAELGQTIAQKYEAYLQRSSSDKLASDEVDPLVPGGCYRAPPHSRWNTPEFTAVFADTLHKMAIPTATQHTWRNDASQ